MREWIRAAVSVCLVLGPVQFAAADEAERERLAALARLYGHVRFFHPANEAQSQDWGRVMVHGVRRARASENPEALASALDSVFGPIAPSVVVTSGALPVESAPSDVPHTHWEHRGVWYGPGSNMYRSQRVGVDGDAALELAVQPGEAVDIELGAGVRARVPLSLALDAGRTLPRADAEQLSRWRTTVDALEFGDASDADVRAASTLMTWAVIRHFFPYFDVVDVDWDARLDHYLARALEAETVPEYYRELCAMVAELEDGHGYVYMDGGLPWAPTATAARFDRARDGSIVVTRSWDESPLRRGDVVVSVDGRTAAEELARWERVTGGSVHLRRHRALNQFGTSDEGGPAAFVVRRMEDGRESKVALRVERSERASMFFVLPEFEHPPVSEVADGVWLINLRDLTKAALDEHLDEIKQARGLIVDFRWGGSGDREANSLTLASHFIDEAVPSKTWQVPGIVRPGLEEIAWGAETWSIFPQEPRLEAEVVFLTSPAVVSFGETVMAFWDHYGLARIVGEPTAGCNGNINRVSDLPSGMTANFTGLRVQKHDGRTLYGIGYEPEVPVSRTVEQIRGGEDVALQEAITLLGDG